MPSEPNAFITPREAVLKARKVLGTNLHRSAIYRWAQSGKVESVRCAGRTLIVAESLERWLEPRPITHATTRVDDSNHNRGEAAAARLHSH